MFETSAAFAKRVNLPERLIRCLARQGILPHVKTGKCWIKININPALSALECYAEQNAQQIAASMPVPIKMMPSPRVVIPKVAVEKKRKGRLPDKVRLAQKAARREALIAAMEERENANCKAL